MAAHGNDAAPLVRRICLSFFCLAIVIVSICIAFPSSSLATSIKEGDSAPDFTLADMSGIERTLSSHLGNEVVLLDFWSIYCVSCVQEMPYLIEIYEKYKDKGFVMYGIDLDSFSPKRVQKFIDGLQFKIPYPVIVDRKREIASAYKVGMLPTTIIIGKDGKIKMSHIGFKLGDEKEFDHLIKDLLN